MSRSSMFITLAVVSLLAAPQPARADAIEGPPACPPGARGSSSHSGQWCLPAPCASDAECHGAGRCIPWRVCTRHASIPPGGLGGFRDPPPPDEETEEVVGTCDPARACTGTEEPPPPTAGRLAEGAPTCTDARYCVPERATPLPSAPPPSTTSSASSSPPSSEASSCACGVSTSSGGRALHALVFLVLALVWRRR